MERITSRANPLIKTVRRLRDDRAFRRKEGCFVADGAKLVEEALKWKVPLSAVLVREDLPVPDLPESVRVAVLPEDLMTYVSRMDAPQGVIAVCKLPPKPALTVCPGLMVLDGIQDPGNLGTILRTADAWEIPVILSDGCADPYNEKTVRATMGAIFRSPPMQAGKEEIVSALETARIPLLVTALSDRAADLRHADLNAAAVVIGSEGNGVCSFFRERAAGEIVIPMSVRCESLNAAIAAAVVLWEMKR